MSDRILVIGASICQATTRMAMALKDAQVSIAEFNNAAGKLRQADGIDAHAFKNINQQLNKIKSIEQDVEFKCALKVGAKGHPQPFYHKGRW